MKTFILVALCSLMALTSMACTSSQTTHTPAPAEKSTHQEMQTAQLANPFADFDSLEEAAQESGFSMTLPRNIPDGYTVTAYRALVNGEKMLEVIYENGDREIRIRKGLVSDNSGIFEEFPETFRKKMKNIPVTLKGRDGTIHVVEWQDGAFFHSISASAYNPQDPSVSGGLPRNIMEALAQDVIEASF